MISLFPINMITDRPQGRDDLRTQRKETGREREGKREGEKNITKGSQCVKCLPFGENALVMIFSFFCCCYGLKCWNCFQSEKLSCLSLRIWNGSIFRSKKSTNRHNDVMQFFFPTLSTHSNPTNAAVSCSLVKSLFHNGSFFIQFAMQPRGYYSVACLVY